MSAPVIVVPPMPEALTWATAQAAWRAGYIAGMDAALAAAEAIVQRAVDAEDNEGAPV